MDNLKYNQFLKVYDQLAENILAENDPKKVVQLIESKFRELDNAFKDAKPYLIGLNNLEADDLKSAQHKVAVDIDNIIGKLLNKESELNQTRLVFDEGMKAVYNSFFIFKEQLEWLFEKPKNYSPQNNDYLLIMDEYRLKNQGSSQDQSGNDLYRGIVFSNSAFRQEFFELLANRVAVENRLVLEQLLLGRKIQGKLQFSGSVELFAMYFSFPFHYRLISSTREVVLNWMVDNFQTYSNRGCFNVKYDTIKKRFPSKEIKTEPESSDQYFHEISDLVKKYV